MIIIDIFIKILVIIFYIVGGYIFYKEMREL